MQTDAEVEVSEEDIVALVDREALPGWVKQALTAASSQGNSCAVAPSSADHGEVATSRARPLRSSERTSMHVPAFRRRLTRVNTGVFPRQFRHQNAVPVLCAACMIERNLHALVGIYTSLLFSNGPCTDGNEH